MSMIAATIQILLLVFFVPAAILKLAGHAHMRREFDSFGYPYWLARLAGSIEIIASALLLAGFWRAPLSVLGALLLVPVMIGACWTNFTRRPPAFGWGTLALLLVCASLAIYRWSMAGL